MVAGMGVTQNICEMKNRIIQDSQMIHPQHGFNHHLEADSIRLSLSSRITNPTVNSAFPCEHVKASQLHHKVQN
jgi:hypothetical protein